MAKDKKDGRANNGGVRIVATIRVKPEDRKIPLMLSVKAKYIDSPEKVFKLRNAIYQFINDNYENN